MVVTLYITGTWMLRSKRISDFKVWLYGRCIVITGGESGLGRHLAVLFSSFGARVIVLGIAQESLDNLPSSIQAIHCDVGDSVELHRYISEISTLHNGIDIVVNNAAIAPTASILSHDCQSIQDAISVNMTSHHVMASKVLPDMMSQKSLQHYFVSVASVAAYLPGAGLSLYCPPKAAIGSLISCLRLELAAMGCTNIHCLCVYPFLMDTAMFKSVELKFQWLFPRLSSKEVSYQILDAMALHIHELYIPWYIFMVPHLLRLLPVAIADQIYCFSGANAAFSR